MIKLAIDKRKKHSFFINDPEPDVPKDIIPMAQCAFEFSMFKISAVHIIYRSWLRSSSTYEPSDPPIRLNNSFHIKIEKIVFPGGTIQALINSHPASQAEKLNVPHCFSTTTDLRLQLLSNA